MSTHGTGQSGDGAYRIIDEGPQIANKRAPWSPRALFFGTWFLWVFSSWVAPIGFFFSALNWARLGNPSKRLPWIGLSVVALALPLALAALRNRSGFPSIEAAHTINAVAIFALAFWVLLEQRPLFDSHTARNGQVAKPWTLWLVIFLSGVLMLWVQVRQKNAELQSAKTPAATRSPAR